MSEKKIGVAIAGLGFVGERAHVPSFRKIPGAEVVGIVGRPGHRSEQAAKELAEKHGFCCYLDYAEALDDPRIHAVVLAVPTPEHFEMASQAISRASTFSARCLWQPRSLRREKWDCWLRRREYY